MAQIILVGTAHFDLKGVSRLEKALLSEQPDIITLENSAAAIEYRHATSKDNRRRILQRFNGLAQTGIRQILDVAGYEFEVCSNYSTENGVPVHLIDDPGTTELIEQLTDESVSNISGLEEMTPDSLTEFIDTSYGLFEDSFTNEIVRAVTRMCVERSRGTIFGQRDTHMANNIRRIAKTTDGVIMHVGGVAHLLDDVQGDTLYEKVKDLDPKRRTLLSYEN